ncbi:MAG: helix-turn-helix domain-containing protein [Nitrospira sp.]|nr:helix-turn-helix domain-containing protein [Nitrospira sp.]
MTTHLQHSNDPNKRELQTTEEAAATLRVKPRTLRDKRFRARIGLFPVYVGKRLRFKTTDLERLLNG